MKKPSKHQAFIFSLLWVTYASAYFLRKPFGIIKVSIQESFELKESYLGYIDLAFSLPYALVSLLLGKVADIFGPKTILGCGLIGSAAATSVMGLTSNYVVFLVLVFISGAFQSLSWPSSCSILSTWFSKKATTSTMGIFGTSLLIGSVGGALLTVYTVSLAGWRNVFYIPSAFVGIMGVVVLLYAKPKEPVLDDQMPECKKMNENNDGNQLCGKTETSLNFWQVLCLPVVPYISVSLCCTKGIRNAVLFWLPFYLTSVLDYTEKEAGLISLTFEIGGFFGSALLTVIIDKCMRHKDLLAMSLVSLLCGLFSSLLLLTQKFGVSFLYSSMFFSGAFSSTAEILGCGSIPIKIGEKFGARASVTGVINGIGSMGNVIEGPIVAWLSYSFGMKSLVPFIVTLSLVGSSASFIALLIERRKEATAHCKDDPEVKL